MFDSKPTFEKIVSQKIGIKIIDFGLSDFVPPSIKLD